MPSRLLCISRRETRVRNSIVDPERDDCDPCASHAELLDEFTLHLLRMNEDVVGEPILDSQRKPIEARILGIPLARIHIVRCEDDPFPQQPVVKHQQRSIEELEFVIPQDMKDLRLGCRSIANQLGIVHRHPEDLPYEAGIRPARLAD